MMWRAVLLGLIVGIALPRPARAQVIERTFPTMRVEGRARVDDLRVEASCEDDEELASTECTLRIRYRLSALSEVTLCEPSCGASASLSGSVIDGEPIHGARVVPAGEQVEVRTEAGVRLDIERGFYGVFLNAPMGLRHPVLGESAFRYHREDFLFGPIFSGDGVEAPAPQLVGPEGSAARLRRDGDAVRLELLAPHGGPPEGPLAHGGPVLMLGGGSPLAGSGGLRFSVAVGYELGLVEHLIVSASVETDFDSLYEAVVIEAALPGFIFAFPSLAVGIGAVARQLGDRDADAALRLRASGQWYVVGVTADFDYYPAVGGWTATVRARASL